MLPGDLDEWLGWMAATWGEVLRLQLDGTVGHGEDIGRGTI